MISQEENNRKHHRLVTALIIVSGAALVLLWYLLNKSDDSSTLLLSAIIPGLLASLFILCTTSIVFGKKFNDIDKTFTQQSNLRKQETEDLKQYMYEQGKMIIAQVHIALQDFEQVMLNKIEAFQKSLSILADTVKMANASFDQNLTSDRETIIKMETKLQQLSETMQHLDSGRLFSSLKAFFSDNLVRSHKRPILDSICGYWIEYIKSRQNEGAPFSIGKFTYDEYEMQYIFSGISYDTHTGRIQYTWASKIILAPIQINENKFFLYYLYERDNNRDHRGRFGIGKLVAKRNASSGEFTLSQGFFFNEHTRDRSFNTMVLKELTGIAHALNCPIEGHEGDANKMIEFLHLLEQSGIHEKWEYNPDDDIDEKNMATVIDLHRKAL